MAFQNDPGLPVCYNFFWLIITVCDYILEQFRYNQIEDISSLSNLIYISKKEFNIFKRLRTLNSSESS